jgi:hypothetical protein
MIGSIEQSLNGRPWAGPSGRVWPFAQAGPHASTGGYPRAEACCQGCSAGVCCHRDRAARGCVLDLIIIGSPNRATIEAFRIFFGESRNIKQ